MSKKVEMYLLFIVLSYAVFISVDNTRFLEMVNDLDHLWLVLFQHIRCSTNDMRGELHIFAKKETHTVSDKQFLNLVSFLEGFYTRDNYAGHILYLHIII